jgi:excinuclease ABC subunit C
MKRRFSRLVKEHGDESPHRERGAAPMTEEQRGGRGSAAIPAWPDLLLIDGGIGQMNAQSRDPRRARHRG